MKIELNNNLINQVINTLRVSAPQKTYRDFLVAVANSTPPDIDYTHFGALKVSSPKYRTLKRFGYYSRSSNSIKVRLVEPTEENKEYIYGLDIKDGNKLKKFLKSNIIGAVKSVRQKI